MPTHKSIKALCRKLIDGDIYHASRLITLERHLEHELMPLLATSGKKAIYHEILDISKIISELATSSLIQDTHMKLATALRLEDAQHQLKKLYQTL
jgi:hypothetical protein